MRGPLFLTQPKLICKSIHKTNSSIVEPTLLSAECEKEGPWPREFNDRSIGWSMDRSVG